MEKKKLHTNEPQLTNYPAPVIPVEEAWASMNQLLNENMPAGGGNDSPKKGGKRYLLLLLLLLISGAVYYAITNKTTENKLAANNRLETLNKSENNEIKQNTNDKLNTTNDDNTASVTADDKNNSPARLGNITVDKGAVANNKQKQSTLAVAAFADDGKLKNTGFFNNNSSRTNTTAALDDSKMLPGDNSPAGTGNYQKDGLIANGHLNKPADKAAAFLKQPVGTETNELTNSKTNVNASATSAEKSIVSNKTVTEEKIIPVNKADNYSEQPLISPATAEIQKNKKQEKKTSAAIKKLGINYGLQWNVSIPLQGVKNYLEGTNGSSQPYVALLPDLWLSKQTGKKGELLLLLHFSNLYAAGEKQLTSSKGRMSIIDSTTVTRSIGLLKTSGFTAGLQYNYNVHKRWSIGAGVNYNLINRALVNVKTTGYYTGALLSEYAEVAEKGGSHWLYLNPAFLTGKVEFFYYWGKLRTGAAILIPLSDMSSVNGNSVRPVNAQLFLRWRLKK